MDNLSDHCRDRSQSHAEVDSFDTFAFNEKLFLDGYEITASIKQSRPFMAEGSQFLSLNPLSQTSERQLSQEIYQEAIEQNIERLLTEILYLEALYCYYEQLNNRFNLADQSYSTEQYPGNSYRANPYQNGSNHYFWHALPHYAKQTFQHAPRNLYKSFVKDTKAIAGQSSNLVTEARHNLGRPVWAFTKFAGLCQSGNLGCAATVSELLQESGIKIPGSASVSGVVGQLTNLGWHKIKIIDKHQFHTGDIVYGLKGSHAHIGIISQADNNQVLVCDNSSSAGTLKERSLESGGSFTPDGRFAGSLYVMRSGGI